MDTPGIEVLITVDYSQCGQALESRTPTNSEFDRSLARIREVMEATPESVDQLRRRLNDLGR